MLLRTKPPPPPPPQVHRHILPEQPTLFTPAFLNIYRRFIGHQSCLPPRSAESKPPIVVAHHRMSLEMPTHFTLPYFDLGCSPPHFFHVGLGVEHADFVPDKLYQLSSRPMLHTIKLPRSPRTRAIQHPTIACHHIPLSLLRC